ncbi:LOW QUALITY PROTEIN: hypothetical protein V2J09_019910 [Rumex salicifolius]
MSSEPPSPRSPSPETSTAIVGQHQDDARSSSSSSSSSSHDSDSSSSIISHNNNNNNNNQGSVRANDDNGDDGVMVSKDSVGGGSSDEVVVSEDAGREDMFLDASEDLGADGRESSTAYTEPRDNSDNEQQIQFRGFDSGMQNDYMVDEMERLRAVLDKTINEKDSIARECKDEIEMAAKAIANIRDQMRGLINGSTGLLSDDSFVVPEMEDSGQRETQLHEMIHECQMLIGTVSHSRKQEEEVVRQLQDDVSVKSHEVGDLHRRVAELTISRDVVDSYVSSVNNMSMEYQLQKDQYVDDAANRMLTSLASVVYVEQLMDNSLSGKVAHLEKAMFALLENYNWFLYETDQLRLRLIEVRPDITEQNDYALVFATSRDELLGLKKKEVESDEKLGLLENEYSKLMEQLDKHKIDAETTNADLQKTRAEFEQEKNRYLNTKEKLSLAVTKGKALVHQRDSLKHTLADKSIELEKCLAQLQEKSTSLQSAELINEELVKSQISTASLQDMLTQKDTLLEKLEEILLRSGLPEGLRSMDISDRIRWLVDDRKTLKDVSVKIDALVDSLFSVYLPEKGPFSNLESQLGWIKESFDQVKTKANILQDEITRIKESAQDEIDKLSSSFSVVLVENDCLKVELDRTTLKYDEVVEKEHQASSEKDEVLRMLQEVSGVKLDKEKDTALLVQEYITKIKEGKSASMQSAQVSMEAFTSMQAYLYVRDQGLVLCEQLLEEEMQEKLELNRVLDDLRMASKEVAVLKGERDSLRKDLERSEDKSTLIREKLSMAVKKGKGLVQEKENFKRLIDERAAEIEEMRTELQQKESTIDNCRNQITRLSAEVGSLASLEVDLVALRDQTTQTEKNLLESNKILQSLMEIIDGIVIPLGLELEHPVDKVKWLGEYLNNCEGEKEVMKQELLAVKLDAETSANKLANVNSTVCTLEDALSVAEKNISELVEEKRNLEVSKTSLEDQLCEAAKELLQKANMLTETTAAKALLETALSQAEITLSVLRKEKEESESSREAAEKDLANLNEEISGLRARLVENSNSLKLLEDSRTQLENRVTLLTKEKNAAEIATNYAENELQKMKEEADASDHKMQDELEKISLLEIALEQAESKLSIISSEKNTAESEKFTEFIDAKASLESALLQAEITISVLGKEKEEFESCLAVAETDVANLKEEVSDLRTRLAKSSSSVKSLEDAAAQLESTISLLVEEKSAIDAGKTIAVKELQQLKEEAGSWDCKLQDALAKINSHEFALEQAENNLSALANEKNVVEKEVFTLNAKLHDTINNFADLQDQNKSVADSQLHEIEYLKKLCGKDGKNEHELERVKRDLYDMVAVVGRVIQKLGGRGLTTDSNSVVTCELVETLEKLVMGLIMEFNNSKTRVQELNAELLANQEVVDELLLKVLEDSLEEKTGPSEGIQERSIFEASSPPPASEISEIEEVSTIVANASISPVPSAAHVRTMRKGSSNDHIALDIASERLITNDITDGDKGHVFKSLNASGLIPKQGKMVADRVDGIWKNQAYLTS